MSFLASHPSWVRGLKSDKMTSKPKFEMVAPYMGAWIEICVYKHS